MSKVKRCLSFSQSVVSIQFLYGAVYEFMYVLCVLRHQLEKSLLVDPWNTVKEADLSMKNVFTLHRSINVLSLSCVNL